MECRRAWRRRAAGERDRRGTRLALPVPWPPLQAGGPRREVSRQRGKDRRGRPQHPEGRVRVRQGRRRCSAHRGHVNRSRRRRRAAHRHAAGGCGGGSARHPHRGRRRRARHAARARRGGHVRALRRVLRREDPRRHSPARRHAVRARLRAARRHLGALPLPDAGAGGRDCRGNLPPGGKAQHPPPLPGQGDGRYDRRAALAAANRGGRCGDAR
mmetsp:Transcript_31931/g.74505  ORF Transcript_31931/g.74505 Transcript_31931/m.74505 type:complete len:214 (+) Transcript_31931:196-837(+)